MSDRKEMMKQRASSPVVGLIGVLKAHSSDKSAIICIFEGEDAKYYGSRVDAFLNGRNRKNVNCKGKSNLLELKKTVEKNTNLDQVNILYFADRDYDYNDITHGTIYFTPCHSVENFYVNKDSLNRIVSDEYGICSVTNKSEFEQIISLFSTLHESFSEATLDLNSWIMCQIEMTKTNKDIELNLNNTKITDFLKIELDKITPLYDVDSLSEFFKKSAPIDIESFESAKQKIIKSGLSESCRGKYALQFFRIFLEKINIELANKNSSIVSATLKPKMLINDSNIISALSQYAKTPSCLNDFLYHHNQMSLAS